MRELEQNIVQLQAHDNLSLTQAQPKNNLKRGCGEGRKSPRSHFLRVALSFAMVMFCVFGVKGQTQRADYSGVYYIANDNSGTGAITPTYGNATSDAQKWYLVPADDPQFSSCIDAYYSSDHATQNGDPERPFLTTYQTNKDAATVPSGVTERPDNSIWIVKKIGNTNYYYVIHATTGKYAIYEVPLPNDPNTNTNSSEGNNGKRKTMHLQTPDNVSYSLDNENYKFTITLDNDGIYRLVPKRRSGWYWNPANNNRLLYHGEKAGNANPVVYQAGLVGVYNSSSDGGSKWHFEDALCEGPAITYDGTIQQYNITWHGSEYDHLPLDDYKIYYSVNNGQVTEYTGPFPASECVLRAWVIGFGMPLSDTTVLDLYSATPSPTFEITCDDGLAMNCSVEEADIYYRINNEITVFDPFNAGFECTLYEGPISSDSSILSGCPSSCPRIYAFAYRNASASGQVDTIYHPNTERPVITLLNETTASISFVTGATLFYTTNGNDPDTLDLSGTGTTEYSGSSPLMINSLYPANDLHIRAIAKLSDRGGSCPVTVMKRPKWPEYEITSECIGASRFHLLTITTQSDRTYWYALSIGSGQQAPSESEFIQYSGQPVDFTTIPGYDGSSVNFTLHLFAKDADDNKSVVLSDDVSFSLDVYTAIPVITFNQNTGIVTITDATAGATIYYTVDGGSVSNHSSPVEINDLASGQVHTITAWALASGLELSCTAVLIVSVPKTITTLTELQNMSANGAYLLGDNITGAGSFVTISTFSGYFDGGGHTITGLTQPLFNTVNGGVVKNVALKGVAISSSADTVGAIACIAKGYSRIYNCGILPNSKEFPDGTHPTVTTTGKCAGGLVGSLRDDSRVINCYSYADVQAAKTASGIVGNNNFASTAEASGGKYTKLRTAIVNCMFYGDIDVATNQYGVYGGKLITNAAATGINSYNYFRNGTKFTAANGHKNTSSGTNNVVGNPTAYNCSFPADERYLTQVEFHRSLLNSNRELCGWWVGSDVAPSTLTTAQVQAIPKDASIIYKWVVDPNLAPYPILKPFGKYPSIVNGNTGTPWFDRTTANPYQGKVLDSLTVTVKSGSHSTAADQIRKIPITDMDTLHYDFGYCKVQLPYFNTVFGDPDGDTWVAKYAGNYTDSVVTGWKVTAVTGGTQGSFVAHWETGYNFADRKCTDKDKYSVSSRVFAQGGNYYVPDGVTSITIEAYWGKAIYIRNAEASYDRVNIQLGASASPNNYFNNGSHFAPAGTRDNNVNGATIQTATEKGSIRGALTAANIDAKKTVYDYALVLVGNVQELVGKNDILHPTQNTRGYTIMSVDLDFDEEPDYCLEWQLGQNMGRQMISPIRFDFLPVIELGIAGKLHNSTNFFSLGCFRSKGHFEVTETAFIRFGQFEFELGDRDEGPIILNGGIYDQYCRGRNNETNQHINYVILGGHVVMPSFTPGAHVNSGAPYQTRHCAVNALGGDFKSFYLTGGYNENIAPYNDNPHCYIDGGHFGTIAAAYKEGIAGNVTWRINHALIGEFYGGGVMSQSTGDNYKIVKGNIDVVIDNSIVGKYCGGPKFGDMVEGKTVTTSATGTIFGHYYGAGNGGTNYVQYASTDETGAPISINDWNTKVNNNYHPGQYRNSAATTAPNTYEADYDFEVINYSTGDQSGKVVSRSYYYSAQFATTNTGNVTSTLTNCTVKNSFYGAGFLGGVTGIVTSVLDSTRVMGSAFGAGYSASSGTVTIHDKTKTPPVPNTYTGMITYNPGGTSTTYTWTHDSGSTSSPVTGDLDELFYTEVPLTNLGAVSENVTLTLKGNTTVGTLEGAPGSQTLKAGTGNVYGGGDQSAVTKNTTVILQEGTKVLGNVFGGGNEGPVGGNSEVIVQDSPTISGTTPFTESTQVTITGPGDDEIYYTIDGSTPTAESIPYNGAFTLTVTTTVKAIVITNGVISSVATKTFTKQ